MPIRISSELPAFKTLGEENIFVMSKERAEHQDIRPLKVIIVNIMPKKIDTENQLMRLLSNTPLQVDIDLLQMASHVSRNTSRHHLDAFYKTFDEVRNNRYDGMIITGAPVELLDFEQVELLERDNRDNGVVKDPHFFNYTHLLGRLRRDFTITTGIPKYQLPHKMFGIFPHRMEVSNSQLLRGFDDIFYVPHSRNTEVRREDIERIPQLEILTSSDISGVHIIANKNGRQYFITGHSEYDRETLANEYKRDLEKGIDIQLPYNYFPDDDPDNVPVFSWRCTANLMFTNWLNYCVYQKTPYNLEELEVRNWNWETSL